MIYLDNAATTPMLEEIVAILGEYGCKNYYNPSALYSHGMTVSREIQAARQAILSQLGGNNYKLIFTSSGSESNNTFILGARLPRGSRVLVSLTEHAAVYNTAMSLSQKGYEVLPIKCNNDGSVDYSHFMSLMTQDTSLISVMLVNNETGAVNDIAKLVKAARAINPKVLFHCDGVQAVGKISVKLSTLGVDAFSVSGHKFCAPKGIGGLFVKKGINFAPLIHGGGQEDGLRSSTENVAGIMAMKTALSKVLNDACLSDMKNLQKYLIAWVREIEPRAIINTDINNSAASIVSFALPNCRGEVLLHGMADRGVIVGTGSACSSHKGDNRIVKALGLPSEYAMGMLRISMGVCTTKQDIDACIQALQESYSDFRKHIK